MLGAKRDHSWLAVLPSLLGKGIRLFDLGVEHGTSHSIRILFQKESSRIYSEIIRRDALLILKHSKTPSIQHPDAWLYVYGSVMQSHGLPQGDSFPLHSHLESK